MQISCGFAPSPRSTEYAVLGEELGFERVWMFDSPALYEDVWVHLCLAAEKTTRVGLGPAVLVPNLRHPVVTASAIAQLERMAPGRAVVAIGTGFTGRMTMGQRPLTWAWTRTYIEQLKALLAGESVEIDGGIAKLIHPHGFSAPTPINVPILVGANGPKGLEVAKDLGDGVMTIGGGQPDFEWCATLCYGTVLDAGESPGSDRALDAAGAGTSVVFHGMYESGPEILDMIPGGPEWRAAIEAVPEAERHLAVHEDHFVRVTERDKPFINGDLVSMFTWTGEADAIKARIDAAEESGITELLYAPMGNDIERELKAFAAAAGIR